MTREALLPKRFRGPGRGKAAALVGLILLLLILAWYQGGERPIRPVEMDIPVPEALS